MLKLPTAAGITVRSQSKALSKFSDMLRHLSLGLLASAISISFLPSIAQESSGADDLRVMSIADCLRG
jgi:hypothetical protein